MVLAIVVVIAIIMAVICFMKKKNRRVTSHSDPTTSTPCREAIPEVAPNDNVSTVQPCSCFQMNFDCAFPTGESEL